MSSFLSGFFGQTNRSPRRSYAVDQDSAGAQEEIEDGFVLLPSPDKRPKFCQQNPQIWTPQSKLEFTHMQQSSAPYSCPAGSSYSQSNFYNPLPSEHGYPGNPKSELTFITTSGVPLKFHKYIDIASRANTGFSPVLQRLNIEKYTYDFTLERQVLQEAASVR